MQALRAQALSTSPLAGLLADEMHLAEALAMVNTTQRAWGEFVRLDPGNVISWNNLAVSHFIKANIQEAMGRAGDAAATWRSTEAFASRAPPSAMTANNLALHAFRLAALEAQRGHQREAVAALALGASHSEWISKNTAPGSWNALSRPVYRRIWPVAVAEALGDYRFGARAGPGVGAGTRPAQAAAGVRTARLFV